jgi:hypothetical protein
MDHARRHRPVGVVPPPQGNRQELLLKATFLVVDADQPTIARE